jgi:hypothetical protein
MADPISTTVNLANFWIGCVGAIAPEAFRLYNLRTQPVLRWSLSYLIFSIPFILIGGFVAWALEPTTKWAAFYSGLTAPVLLTTAMKDAAKAQKELISTQTEIKELENKLNNSEEEKLKLKTEIDTLRSTIHPFEVGELSSQLPIEFPPVSPTLAEPTAHPAPYSPPAFPVANTGSYTSSESVNSEYRSKSHSNISRTLLFLISIFLGAGISIVAASTIFKSTAISSILGIFIGVIAIVIIVRIISQVLRKNLYFQDFLKGL